MNEVPLGVGNPDDPLYGVLDQDQNFFYLVSCNKSIVEHAVALLNSKKSVKLEVISDSVNYYHNIIDNTVCTNWGIEYSPEKVCVPCKTNHSSETGYITKNLLLFLSTREKLYNFCQTIDEFCIKRIGMDLPEQSLCDRFADDPWFNLATSKEVDNFNFVRAEFKQDLDDIQSVFDLDLELADYDQQIHSRMLNLPIEHKFKKIFYEF